MRVANVYPHRDRTKKHQMPCRQATKWPKDNNSYENDDPEGAQFSKTWYTRNRQAATAQGNHFLAPVRQGTAGPVKKTTAPISPNRVTMMEA